MPFTAKEIIRALERGGWVQTRQVGSHVRLVHPEKPSNSVTVSVHQGKEIPVGTLHAILKATGLTLAKFEELLKR